MKKIIIPLLFVLIASLLLSSVSALTISYNETITGCPSGSILGGTQTDEYFTVLKQGTPTIEKLSANSCTTVSSNGISIPNAQSPQDMSFDDGKIYYMGYTNVAPFTSYLYVIDYDTLTVDKGCYLDASYSLMMADGGYIYTYSSSGLHKFDDDCIPLDITSNPETFSGTPVGLVRVNEDNFALITTTTAYEIQDTWGSVLDEQSISFGTNTGYDWSNYDDTRLYQQIDTNSIKLYSISDFTEDPFIYYENDTYSRQQCMTSDTYCNNSDYVITLFGDIEFICENSSDVSYCSNGCSDDVDENGTIYGVCEQIGCENECNVIGQNTCFTSNAYAICGQYDQDACLEYGSVLSCPANQYCYSDNLGAYCNTTQGDYYYTQDSLSVSLERYSNTGTLESEGTTQTVWGSEFLYKVGSFFNNLITKKTVVVSTALDSQEVTYVSETYDNTQTTSADYVAFNCNYDEQIIFQDALTHGDLLNNGWSGEEIKTDVDGYTYNAIKDEDVTFTFNQSENAKIEILQAPKLDETKDYELNIYSGTTLLTSIELATDTSAKTVTITDLVNSEIISFTECPDPNAELRSVYYEFSFIDDIETVNLKIALETYVLGQTVFQYYYSLPIPTGSSLRPDTIEWIHNGKELAVYQVSGVSVEDYPIFQQNTNNEKQITCSFTEPECYIVRAYGNSQGMPTYYFYDDVRTCVTDVGGLQIVAPDVDVTGGRDLIESLLDRDFTSNEKILYGSLMLVLVFMIFVVASLMNNSSLPIIFGSVVTGLLLVALSIVGWIPAWIIVLFGVIGAFIGVGIMRGGLLGRSE